MLLDEIKNYVYQETQQNSNALGPSFYQEHLDVVSTYGKQLAEQLNANMEIVELSAYLHDISAVQDFSTLPNHAAASAEIGKDFLKQHGYPADLVIQVQQAILAHSTPLPIGEGRPEAVCLSNADAMSQITNPVYWLYFAFSIRRLDFEQGRAWLMERVETNWGKLIQPAKELIETKYNEAVRWLKL
jgi:uncharacterized protein